MRSKNFIRFFRTTIMKLRWRFSHRLLSHLNGQNEIWHFIGKYILFYNFLMSCYSQISDPLWLCRLSRPKNPKYSPTSIEIATPDLAKRLIIEAESEEHADIFASAFRKAIQKANDENISTLNTLIASNGVFNSSDQHWKDLNQSRTF